MKKCKNVVLVLAVMLCALFASTTNVKAQEEYTREDLKEYIIAEMEKMSVAIDVSHFGDARVFETKEEILNFLTRCKEHVIWTGLTPYFYSDFIKETGEYVINIVRPRYVCTKQNAEDAIKAADKLLEGIKGNDNLSDVEKALLIHDRLIVSCEYDELYYNIDPERIPALSHSGYAALTKNITVCDGYTAAYRYLLGQVGIKSDICYSKELWHVWNIVYIDGEAYHVDVTWDDPMADTEGYVSHKNFLVSSDKLYNMGHYADDYDTTPDSKKYDNAFWCDSNAEFQLIDDKIYYINNKKDKLIEWDGDKHTTLCKVSDRWGKFPMANFNYALLSNDGENLLFSLADAVYSFDIATKEKKLVYQPEKVSEDMDIYGFTYKDGEYICELNNEAFIYNEANSQRYMLIIEAIFVVAVIIFVVIIVFIVKFFKKRKKKKLLKKQASETIETTEENNSEQQE